MSYTDIICPSSIIICRFVSLLYLLYESSVVTHESDYNLSRIKYALDLVFVIIIYYLVSKSLTCYNKLDVLP